MANAARGRRQRLAYITTELAKEAPYYAGAYGAALVSDTIDSTDALIFLIGTNLGAAAYEFGLGRVSHAIVDRRSHDNRPSPPPATPVDFRPDS